MPWSWNSVRADSKPVVRRQRGSPLETISWTRWLKRRNRMRVWRIRWAWRTIEKWSSKISFSLTTSKYWSTRRCSRKLPPFSLRACKVRRETKIRKRSNRRSQEAKFRWSNLENWTRWASKSCRMRERRRTFSRRKIRIFWQTITSWSPNWRGTRIRNRLRFATFHTVIV